MTKRFLFISVISTVIFFATKLSAQDSSDTQMPGKWTLQACIDYAKQHNIQLNSLRLTQQSSEQELLQSKAAKLPNLSGSVSQSVTANKNANLYAENPNSGVGGVQSQANFAGNYSLNSSWVLYMADILIMTSGRKIFSCSLPTLTFCKHRMILRCK